MAGRHEVILAVKPGPEKRGMEHGRKVIMNKFTGNKQ